MNVTLYDLPLTAADAGGAQQLERAMESYLGARADTPQILQQTLAADPGHLMARCMMGYLSRLAGDPRNSANARALHAALADTVADGVCSDWERGHVEALGLWLADDLEHLMRHFEALLGRYPTDPLALRMLHYLYFYAGDGRRMRDSVARKLSYYPEDHPFAGYVRGMLAFGLEEAGEYDKAERYAREAVDLNSRDLWAAHAMAHVLQMQGRTEEGIEWIDALRPNWLDANNFRNHLYWHQSLYFLSRDEFERVLDIYDREVGPAVADDFYLDMCNATSLLLRLQARGQDVGERWTALAAVAERHVEDRELVFASLHHLMPLLVTGNPAAAELLAALEGWAGEAGDQASVVREVALDVAGFLVAVQQGDHQRALQLFDAFRYRLYRIGGSHAQRELFDVVALHTAERGGAARWAEEFRAERRIAQARAAAIRNV
ncbi:MAG: tetratricopeptide repeat protein [Pseudomonadales bacterium]